MKLGLGFRIVLGSMVWLGSAPAMAQEPPPVKDQYTKTEVMIPMRDGVKLYTAIYTPKNNGEAYPIIMTRTPYSCAPYGVAQYPRRLGPNQYLREEGYIFVVQDVRGRYKSEGQFQEMTPAIPVKTTALQTDESSDCYDTIEWLLKHTRNNGRVGLYGISYPGFYAAAGLPNAHPALKAVSPQAPVTDEFIGDDCNHNGAFFLLDNFGFYNHFDGTRSANGEKYESLFPFSSNDAYSFFLNMGALKNSNGPQWFNGRGAIYNQVLTHDTYDHFWKARNLRPHLKQVKPAVLVVGGWFDAEDLFGPLQTYACIEAQTPGNDNRIVMGPWTHGAWSYPQWNSYATYSFGQNLNAHYQKNIETPFFNYYLKRKGTLNLPEATVFETGSNRWREFATWPPKEARPTSFYLQAGSGLRHQPDSGKTSFTPYRSDPANPVPYTAMITGSRNNQYLGEDQRFASTRADVLSFASTPLTENLTVGGPIPVNLFMSTTGTDADVVVKVVDVHPPDPAHPERPELQQLVRADIFRGKFRQSFEKPEPFMPGEVTPVSFTLNAVSHTFLKGHQIMVQVQSSWFPLADRNPQQFLSIPQAIDADYRPADIRIYHSIRYPSAVALPVLPQ